jgi:hypothetical protein
VKISIFLAGCFSGFSVLQLFPTRYYRDSLSRGTLRSSLHPLSWVARSAR